MKGRQAVLGRYSDADKPAGQQRIGACLDDKQGHHRLLLPTSNRT